MLKKIAQKKRGDHKVLCSCRGHTCNMACVFHFILKPSVLLIMELTRLSLHVRGMSRLNRVHNSPIADMSTC